MDELMNSVMLRLISIYIYCMISMCAKHECFGDAWWVHKLTLVVR